MLCKPWLLSNYLFFSLFLFFGGLFYKAFWIYTLPTLILHSKFYWILDLNTIVYFFLDTIKRTRIYWIYFDLKIKLNTIVYLRFGYSKGRRIVHLDLDTFCVSWFTDREIQIKVSKKLKIKERIIPVSAKINIIIFTFPAN